MDRSPKTEREDIAGVSSVPIRGIAKTTRGGLAVAPCIFHRRLKADQKSTVAETMNPSSFLSGVPAGVSSSFICHSAMNLKWG